MPSIEVATTDTNCASSQWTFAHAVKDASGATVTASFITLSSDRVISIESSDFNDVGHYTVEVTASLSGLPDIVRSFNLEVQGCTAKFSDFAFSEYTVENDTPLGWTDAEAACVAKGGHLVSFNSIDERDKVFVLA